MTFNITDFARITMAGQSVAPAIWSYGTSNTFATAQASAYFNDVAANLNIGDWIYIKASDSNLAVKVTAVTPNVTVAVISNFSAALNSAQILVGNGSNIATAVAMSGDVHIDNTGATTVQRTLTGAVAGNVAINSVLGALPVLHAVAVTGGSTANYDVVLTNKTIVTDAWVQLNGLGTASDTIQVKNSTNAITNAMDINAADTTIVRAGQVNDANASIAAGGTLRVAQVDGGGSDCPACTVYVLGWHVV